MFCPSKALDRFRDQTFLSDMRRSKRSSSAQRAFAGEQLCHATGFTLYRVSDFETLRKAYFILVRADAK